ncbi:MATE family efflux transporter, partial [uncultured Cetobacterium sp.]
GAQPIIGYNFGARQYKRVEKTYKLSANIGILFFLVALFFIQLFPQEIIGLFNKNPNIMKMSVTGVRIYLIAMPAIALGMAGSNYFLAIGKGKAAMFLSLLRQVVLLVPLIILLSKTFGLIGIWMAQPICDLIAAGVTLYMVVNNLKIYRKLD